MSQTKNKKRGRRTQRQTSWPLLMLVGGGILLLFAAAFVFNRPEQNKVPIEVNGAPSLKVDRQEVNLGDVKLDKTVSVSFQISNVGDQPLKFSQAPYVEVLEGC